MEGAMPAGGSLIDPVEFGEVLATVKATAGDVSDVKNMLVAQNGRIRALERWRDRFAGALTVMVALTPLVIFEFRQEIGLWMRGLGGFI